MPASKPTVHYAHFSLGSNLGNIVTNIVREKAWYQGNRDGAILSLLRSLQGITIPQCEQVIDGTLKLKTNRDKLTMRLVKDHWTPPPPKPLEPEVPEEPTPVEPGPSDDLMDGLKARALVAVAGMNLGPEQRERMQRLVMSEGHDPDLKEDPEFENDSGWLDREGRYWGCELGLHIVLADKLAKAFFPDYDGDNAERRLEVEGWMKCTGGHWYETEMPPTSEQRYTFKRWEKKHTVRKYYSRRDY